MFPHTSRYILENIGHSVCSAAEISWQDSHLSFHKHFLILSVWQNWKLQSIASVMIGRLWYCKFLSLCSFKIKKGKNLKNIAGLKVYTGIQCLMSLEGFCCHIVFLNIHFQESHQNFEPLTKILQNQSFALQYKLVFKISIKMEEKVFVFLYNY